MRRSDLIELFFVLGLFAVGVVTALVVVTSFLAALAHALRRVSPENRRMEPGQVWMCLIPVFNIVWATVTVERIAESLRDEFRSRAMDGPHEKYGRTYGLTTLVLLAFGVLFYPAFITYPIALGFFIAYWRQINRYAARLRPGAYAPPPTDEGW
jgi:hypothetical protein